MGEQIRITVRGAATVPFTQLLPFQGNLKDLDRERYEELRNGIKRFGFTFVFHCWQHQGKHYIIDGHQRLKTIQMMVEKEGFACPPLPVALVEARDFAEAKRKILAGASQYGKVTEKGLNEFLKENDIPFDEVVAHFHFPEIDFGDFGAAFFPQPGDDKDAGNLQAPAVGDTKMGSDAVRQVQLFFDAPTHEEFMAKANQLLAPMIKTNITDVVMECVREIHKVRFPAAK